MEGIVYLSAKGGQRKDLLNILHLFHNINHRGSPNILLKSLSPSPSLYLSKSRTTTRITSQNYNTKMDTLTRRISTLHLRKKPSTAIVQGSVASRGSNLTTCTSFMSSGSLPNDPVNTPPPTYSRLVPRIFYYPEGTTDAIPKTTHSKAALTSAFDAAACKRPQATQANVQCFMVGSGRDIQLQIFTENGPHEEDYKTLAQTLGTLHLKYLVFDMEYLSCPTCINDLKSQAQNERVRPQTRQTWARN